jgi:hypothetical protein
MILAILDSENFVLATVVHDPNKGPRPTGIECDDSVIPGMIWDGKSFSKPHGQQKRKSIQEQIDELRAMIEAKK